MIKSTSSQFHSKDIVAEYVATREEILFRLRVQQDTINYSFIAAGFLATLLGVNIDIRTQLVLLLIGPIMCIFLQLIYAKQHMFIELLSKYISTELGFEVSLSDNMPLGKQTPFDGWENFLSSFYTHSHLNFYSKLLGYAEGGFPTIIGFLFLAAFARLLWINRTQITDDFNTLLVWGSIDLLGLGIAIYIGTRVRGWVAQRRQVEVTEVYKPK